VLGRNIGHELVAGAVRMYFLTGAQIGQRNHHIVAAIQLQQASLCQGLRHFFLPPRHGVG
jgi:hypothetical protein